MLAMLLLAALAWGSTVEFTHHHGPDAGTGDSLSGTVPSATDGGATQISSSNTNGQTSKSRSDAECSICQLHQNLSATAIGLTPGVGPTETCGLNTLPGIVVPLSEFSSTGQGRAPPSIL